MSSVSNKPLTRLLQQSLRGNKQAFGDFYEQLLPEIYRYIFYRVNDQQTAEDLTETVFLKAWESLQGNRRVPNNPRAWIYRIAHNQTVDYYRTRKQHTSLDAAQNLPAGQGETPEIHQAAQEQYDLVHSLLNQLDPQLRQVLICRFLLGMSHKETAQTLSLTPGHVRVLQHRALKQLRAIAPKDFSL